jgi:Peptidase family M1 domain
MNRYGSVVLAALFCAALPLASPLAAQQERRGRIDVDNYNIEAEIDPTAQTLKATVAVKFTPIDDVTSASFELNNALNVSRVVDGTGRQIPASRNQQSFTVQLSFPDKLPKGQANTVVFTYDGKLTGNEESPVYGIKFASIKPDLTYLMYPARWIPVNEYTTDRFTADMRVAVPAGYHVVAPGLGDGSDRAANGFTSYRFRYTNPSFPASLAVVQGDGQRVSSQGVTTTLYFREHKNMAQAYGEEVGKMMTFFTGTYGLAPHANLTVIETETGTPNGYSAPGILFFSPRTIGTQVNPRALANQVARQWWGLLVSPTTRNHLWITNGAARYAEFLWIEQQHGAGALESEVRDTFIEALTVESVPLIQAARLEDYSPEYWASTAGKGAAVLHMLRGVIGDDKFKQFLKTVPERFAWKSVNTDDVRSVAEQISGQKLPWFFLEWIESSGAPEFKLEYTVFRTAKGFRVMGKVAQDLDTFRMPVEMRIETEGNPEDKKVDVVGTSSEFIVETFGKPRKITLDPNNKVLRYSNPVRVAVAIRRGEQFAEVGDFTESLKEYQKALDVNKSSSLAHYRVAEIFMLQNNYQSAANEFRETLNGDLEPKWTEVWAHINLGKIFDVTGQRERAVNEYQLAQRTKDNSQNAQEEVQRYLKQPYERPRTNL